MLGQLVLTMDNFISIIRKYQTKNIIEVFAKLSNEIFKNQHKKETLNYFPWLPIKYCRSPHTTETGTVALPAWNIQNIQYLSIKHGNDWRRETIKTNQELAAIVSCYRRHENRHSGSEKITSASTAYKYMFGMCYEQFLYGNLSWVFQRFNRNYHILFGSNSINRPIEIDAVIQERIGLSTKELVIIYLIILWLCDTTPDILTAPETLYRKKTETILTKENIKKVIDYYTVSYRDVKESSIAHQIFYNKPFVKTQKGITLMTNWYLIWMLIADGLYWIVRDHYKETDDQDFIEKFGIMFESYFQELLSTYFREGQYQKLSPAKQKKGKQLKGADFVLFFDNAVVLIEIKSALINLQAKQQNPNIELIDTYLDRNIKKACIQLQESEKKFAGMKPVVKFILLYENILSTAIMQSTMSDIAVNNKSTYIITIEDMENFLVLHKNDKEKAEAVLSRLLTEKTNDFSGLQAELHKAEASTSHHSLTEINHFDFFERILNDELCKATLSATSIQK